MRPRFGLLVLLAALLLPRHAAAQDEDQRYELSNFDVTIQVRPDGTYEVEETLTYDFQQGTFSYAYRVLDTDDVAAIRDVRVTSPDAPVDSLRRTPDDGDVRLRWTYPERSAPATFTIRYVIEGAVYQRGDRNVVYRDVVDAGATVPTRDVGVRVVLPAAFGLAPDSVSVDPADEATVEASAGPVVAAFHRGLVDEGDEYPVEVAFSKRVPGRYWATTGDLFLGLFLFLLGTGGGIAFNLRWKGATAERTAKTPPRDVSLPAGAVLLEQSATPLFTAVLFDLARRDHLTLRHDEEAGWLETTDVVRFDLHPTPDDLSAFERALVQRLDGPETIGDFWADSGSFRREQFGTVRTRVIEAGWMDSHRTRSTLCFVGTGTAVVAGIGLGIVTSGLATLLTVGASLGIGVGTLFAGARRHTLTEAGARRAAALRSYLDHEKDEIDRLRGTDPARAAERLADALPWLVYHDEVSSAWLEEVQDALDDASTVPDLPGGFVSLAVSDDESAPVAAFLPVVTVMGAMESSGAGAAGAAAAGGAAGAAGGGAAGAG